MLSPESRMVVQDSNIDFSTQGEILLNFDSKFQVCLWEGVKRAENNVIPQALFSQDIKQDVRFKFFPNQFVWGKKVDISCLKNYLSNTLTKTAGASQDEEDNVQKPRKFVGIGICRKFAYNTVAGKRMEKEIFFPKTQHKFSTWYDTITCLQLNGTEQTLLYIAFKQHFF